MTPYNRPPKELQDLWYKKLKDKGFNDIEQSEFLLRTKSITESSNLPSKIRYFQLAGQFLHEYKFESKLDRLIWLNHSNGLGLRQLKKVIDKKAVKKISKERIGHTVKRLATIMLQQFNNSEELYE